MNKTEADKYDYKKDLSIDRNDLHKECVRQPQEMAKYITAHSQSIFDRDSKKRELQVARADAELDIRSNPETYGLDKITEGAVKAATDKDEEVIRLEDELIACDYAVNLMRGALGAFRDRRMALEGLISLLTMGYWNLEPRPDKQLTTTEEKANREAQKAALKDKLPRRD
jgi:hypothetical protein